MFGVSFLELAVIFAVALLVFGPDKLPELASRLGKLSAELKKASDAVRREFYNSLYAPVSEEMLKTERSLTTISNEVKASASPAIPVPEKTDVQPTGKNDQE